MIPDEETLAEKLCRPEEDIVLHSDDVEEVVPRVFEVSRDIFPAAKRIGKRAFFNEKKKTKP